MTRPISAGAAVARPSARTTAPPHSGRRTGSPHLRAATLQRTLLGRDETLQRSTWLLLAGMLGASWAVFSTSFDNPFRDDDFAFLARVREARSGWDLLRFGPGFSFYRPASLLLFKLEYALFGAHGGRFLAFNCALHMLNAGLFLLVLLRLRVHEKAAVLAAGAFALGFGHYAKQVMWACTGGALLAVGLGLLAMLWTLRLVQDDTSRARALVRLTAIAGFLVFAPLLHEASLVTPVVLCGLLAYSARGRTIGWRSLLVVSLIVPAAWVGFLMAFGSTYNGYDGMFQRVLGAPAQLFGYLGLILWPVQGSRVDWASSVRLVCSCVTAVTVLWFLGTGSRRERVFILWLGAALLPFCLIPMPEGWLEPRYLYPASLPANGLAVTLLARAYARRGKLWRLFCVTAAAFVLCGTVCLELGLEQRWDAYSNEQSQQEQAASLILEP